MTLQPFVVGDRLVKMPARMKRRYAVLRHVATCTFTTGVWYSEREVDDKLRAWCDGGETDHVTVRRYLVDLGLLERDGQTYWLTRVAADQPEQPVL